MSWVAESAKVSETLRMREVCKAYRIMEGCKEINFEEGCVAWWMREASEACGWREHNFLLIMVCDAFI